MLLSRISLLFSLTVIVATSLEPPSSLISPSLPSTTQALDHFTIRPRSEPVEYKVVELSGEGQLKGFEKRLRKRCFYIGTFFQR